ncbi:ribokinase [Caldalkalibacillus salinus]|uniref:ribokinase n=1 Tax=Caldalkalibacillus salinus TaxID=2803787 RepID=UPI001923F5BC|nr:ribokinase [Caldalkalibacillus salinus]
MSHIVVVGSINMDLVVESNHFPRKGETLLGQTFSQIKGGKGANQAVAAARLGASVSMIGAVGEDAFGETLYTALEEEGIHMHGVRKVKEQTTGIAQITLAEQDNTILVVPGANKSCTPEWLAQHRQTLLQADIILLQLEIPLETVEATIKLAHEYFIPIILNPAPAQNISPHLLKKVTYLTPNETELQTLSSDQYLQSHGEKEMNENTHTDDSQSDQPEIDTTTQAAYQEKHRIERLLRHGVKYCIVTKGAKGVAFAYLDDGQMILRDCPSYKADVVDTTGAGDAFNAGFAVALAEDKPLDKAISFASAVAAEAVSQYGAQPGMPYRDQIDKHISENGCRP